MIQALNSREIRRTCPPQSLNPEKLNGTLTTQYLIGQDRAVKALKMGLGIHAKGFNIYVAGQPGTGRLTAIKNFLNEFAKQVPFPSDWVYVNNFQDSYYPTVLKFPKGKAREFKEDMKNLIEEVRNSLNKSFESESFTKHQEEIMQEFNKERDEILSQLNQEAQKRGFTLKYNSTGISAIKLNQDNKPITNQEFAKLGEQEQEQIKKQRDEINKIINQSLRQTREKEKELNKKLAELENHTALNAIGILFEELKEKYQPMAVEGVMEYFDDVKKHILNNIKHLLQKNEGQQNPLFNWGNMGQEKSILKLYEVNILVDNGDIDSAPVIIEQNPTYNNLFGKIEKEAHFGSLTTDYTLIREGSLHRANEGFLVIPVEELITNPFSYESLKRALVNQEIRIEEIGERYGMISGKSLKPQSIPLNCKVLLIGDHRLYQLLNAYDKDFKELFKVKADFNTEMDFNDENLAHYVQFLSRICEKEGLLGLNEEGTSKMVEFGIRLAEDQQKLSARFGDILDMLREANYYAHLDSSQEISSQHVHQAIEEKKYRSNLLQEKINELINRKVLHIDLEGKEVGQVNGLAIIDLGDISFGRPNRITVSSRLGQEGIIDIEREAKLGGKIHSKGVMILTGYLSETFGKDFPMTLSASIVFEQSYSEVEGDSASSTELYALLSSLAEVPVYQGIAVTGSVDQKGDVQAVGGINEKVEGFFELCKIKGLDGKQGVIIPAANQQNLMLKEEIVEAVQDGKFHIWAVNHIDEGIELLTGVPAGNWEGEGFTHGSVKQLVYEQMEEMAKRMQSFKKELNHHNQGNL